MSGKDRQGSCCGCLLFKFWNLWIRLLGGELTSKNEAQIRYYSRSMHLCNRKIARTKTIVVVNLISHKQLCRNSLHSRSKVVFKAACLLQRCLNLLYVRKRLSYRD